MYKWTSWLTRDMFITNPTLDQAIGSQIMLFLVSIKSLFENVSVYVFFFFSPQHLTAYIPDFFLL